MISGEPRKLVLPVLFAIACSYSAVAGPESAPSHCSLREFNPPANAVVDRHTVLSAALDYSIEDNSFSRNTYFAHVLFNAADGKTFNISKRLDDGVEIRQRVGVVLIQHPIKKELKEKFLTKPVTVRFAVLKRTGELDSIIVAESEPITYRVAP